ncbi:N-acetylmuramoyl-L-alanine amidase family protein [uncultured Clostridium sp.]|uniref:N-acetylmuramoyl-L-alanine amidase family protein n=1 Tax=uncultured Clostridium sp. TaxID=59620 RepID=UPI0025F326DE|nr:N-acetylmuramoyl-L-alanine amidase family protein [uncultured Clostridium sp.]
MIKRINKIAALMVAATSAASIVPVASASAAEKLAVNEGTITKAVAFDGTYVFDGYRTDNDESGLYFNNGKDVMVDADEDYSYDKLSKYGDKYVTVEDGDDYLVDLSTGKILEDESVEDLKTNVETKLTTTLKKTDRYGSITTTGAGVSAERIKENTFGDVYYMYSVVPGSDAKGTADATVGNSSNALVGFTNQSGKYVDASKTANLYVYSETKGATVKVSEYNEPVDYTVNNVKHQIKASLENVKAIAQDSDYIYAVATVKITDGVKGGDVKTSTQYFLQKISKTQGSKEDGAYLPKNVVSYEIDEDGTFKNKDVATAAGLLKDGVDGDYSVVENGYQVKNGVLYITTVNDTKDSVKVYTVKLNKTKLDTKAGVKNVDTYVAIVNDDVDQDIINTADEAAISIDAEGNTWALNKGTIYKFDGSSFKAMYSVDRSLNVLDVYNDKNVIAWEEGGDVFATTSKATNNDTTTDEDDKKEDSAVKAGWVKNSDGTWSYNKADGTKATGWLLDGSTWYYLNANGIMQTGWLNLNGTWYYLNSNGSMKTGWLNDNGTWYYLQSSGAMKTGWLNDNGTWYYLNSNGSMKTGWLKDTDGRWYFLQSNGAMATNTTIDGYRLGSNGAWIR